MTNPPILPPEVEKEFDELVAELNANYGVDEYRAFLAKAIAEERGKVKADLLKIADAGEYEDLRREVESYFKNSK